MPLNLDPWLKQLSLTDKQAHHALLNPDWTPLQRRITDEVQNAYNEGRPARLIVLKSRQLGCSTIAGGIGFAWTTMFPNTLAFVVAHTSQSTLYLFDKMRYFYETWPHRRSYPTRFSSRREIMFNNNNSSIRVQTARNPDALRGRTITFAHLSEVAFWEKQEENMVAIRTAVPQAPGTVIVIESTPCGMGGWFYDTWNKAVAGQNDYVPIFAPWFTHHEYIPCYGFKCRDGTCETCASQSRIRPEGEEEKDLMRLGCDLPHIAWRRWALPNLAHGSTDWFNQEFPKDQESCFLTSGVMVFPHVYLDRVYERVRPAIGRLGKEGFTLDSTGPLRIFKPPSKDIEWGRYFIGADVGFGVKDGDYSAAQVINRQTKEQVAVWHGRINPYAFADELMKLGRYYNNAVIACESDGPGMGSLGRLVGNYPNLWHTRLMDRVPGRQRSDVQIGFSNNWKRKQWLVTQLADAVERGDITLHDRQTFDELKSYAFFGDKGDTFGPAEDGHDDLVMSLGIAVLCERLESPVPPYETRPGPRGKDSKVVFGESVDVGQMIWGEDEASA